MLWDDVPASEQQLVLLRNAGYVMAKPLTRTEAARLIREYRRNPAQPVPAVQSALTRAAPTTAPPTATLEPSTGELSESTRMKAHGLRTAYEDAKRDLVTKPDAPNVRADAASTSTARMQFWKDTCCEVREMQIGSVQIFELYQRHGCRFFAPTREQVQEVLDALDAALPVWDRDHPELFYQTLELNFPQLLRRAF
jgi:hypothetical protein